MKEYCICEAVIEHLDDSLLKIILGVEMIFRFHKFTPPYGGVNF